MGYLVHGGKKHNFDDRALAHLKMVIGSKLRRQEGFYLSWDVDADGGSGRISLWVSSSTPLEFRFSGNRPPALNKKWLDVMAESSFGPRGLLFIDEDLATSIDTSDHSQLP